MSRIVVTEFLSLDGVMEDPGGAESFRHGGWVFKFQGPEGGKFKLEEQLAADAMLLGRVTYEGFAAAWPEREDEQGFAATMNSMPKYVVSSTLGELGWNNSKLVTGGFDGIAALRAHEDVGDLLVAGSRALTRSLLAAGLVDELRLMVFPVVLGSGKRLFADSDDALTLALKEARTLDSSNLLLIYEQTDRGV
jgi:dihydrofolate reductase